MAAGVSDHVWKIDDIVALLKLASSILRRGETSRQRPGYRRGRLCPRARLVHLLPARGCGLVGCPACPGSNRAAPRAHVVGASAQGREAGFQLTGYRSLGTLADAGVRHHRVLGLPKCRRRVYGRVQQPLRAARPFPEVRAALASAHVARRHECPSGRRTRAVGREGYLAPPDHGATDCVHQYRQRHSDDERDSFTRADCLPTARGCQRPRPIATRRHGDGVLPTPRRGRALRWH
jgi:hypothetical protein